MAVDDGKAPLYGIKLVLAAIVLAVANFVVVLDMTIANVSLPHIAGSLAISPTQGTWIITSYAVADAITVPLSGWLAGRFGSVRLFMGCLIAFGVASFLCGLSTTLGMMVVCRILQGFAGGPLMPLTQSLIMRVFPRGKEPVGMSIWAMTITTGPIAGPILGGWLSDNYSWHWIFFINLPIVAISVIMVSKLLLGSETKKIKVPIDIGGLVLLVTFVSALQLALDLGREYDWFGSKEIVILMIIAAIGFVSFVIWEFTAKNPIVDIRIFRHRGFTVATLALSMVFAAYFSLIVLTPLWLQSVMGYTASQAGLVVAGTGISAVFMSPIAPRIMQRVDPRIPVIIGICYMAFIILLRANWSLEDNFMTLFMPHLLLGMGVPYFFMGLTTLGLSNLPPNEITSAAGIMNFIRTIVGAMGTATATTMWDTGSETIRSNMVGELNDQAMWMDKLGGLGIGMDRAKTVISNLVDAQAMTLSYIHLVYLVSVMILFAASIVLFIPKPKKGGPPPPAGH